MVFNMGFRSEVNERTGGQIIFYRTVMSIGVLQAVTVSHGNICQSHKGTNFTILSDYRSTFQDRARI